MGVSLDWRQGMIRFGAEHHKIPEPWSGCVSIIRDGDLALLYAAAGTSIVKHFPEIRRRLRAEGFRRVRWERYEDGVVHVTEFDI